MNYTEYTTIKNKFSAAPNLCDLFKLLSIETWKRIEHAYLKPKMKIYETTITQNLIFSINAYSDQYGLNIDIFEATDEKTNGNDFELIIRFPNENLEYYAPVQAKKVYRNGRYTSMEHGVQIESLMDYARGLNARPMYLLYNFATSPLRRGIRLTSPMELTGCSLISAEHLFTNHYNRRVKRDGSTAWLIPHFYDLNPDHAFAWHELACPDTVSDFYSVLKRNGIVNRALPSKIEELVFSNSNLKQGFYPMNTFIKDEDWISIKDLSVPSTDNIGYRVVEAYSVDTKQSNQTGEDDKIQRNSKEVEKIYPKFSPRSRIVITK